jgi:hypothetical protein
MPVSGEIPNQQALLALLAAAQLMVAPVVTIAPPLRNCSFRAARALPSGRSGHVIAASAKPF